MRRTAAKRFLLSTLSVLAMMGGCPGSGGLMGGIPWSGMWGGSPWNMMWGSGLGQMMWGH